VKRVLWVIGFFAAVVLVAWLTERALDRWWL
jgi:hypothetical protein